MKRDGGGDRPGKGDMSDSRKPYIQENPTAEELEALILHLEKVEGQLETMNRRLGAMERRQERFAQFVRYMLDLYDRNAARLHLLDGRDGKESVEEILASKPARRLREKQRRRSTQSRRPTGIPVRPE
jgi:hypothetical protein